MAATIGAQTGIGIYARVGGSSSKTNVEGVNYTNSHLNTETLNINTQGDTTLTGTTAKAKTINANVGGKSQYCERTKMKTNLRQNQAAVV